MSYPTAVIFVLANGKTMEVWLPPDFSYAVKDGGLAIFHHDSEVAGVLSARPLIPDPLHEGEVHDSATEAEHHGQGDDSDVDQP